MNVSVALNEKRDLSAVCVNSENVNESVCLFSGHSVGIQFGCLHFFFLLGLRQTHCMFVCVFLFWVL